MSLAKLLSEEADVQVLATTEHGSVDLVFSQRARVAAIQFNGPCEEMLPLCHGMCCGLRPGYNVILQPDEESRFQSVPHPRFPGKLILASRPDTLNCVYQDNNNGFCTIQANKPWACSVWHCSPGGKNSDGSTPRFRDAGWFLSPVGGNLQDIMGDEYEKLRKENEEVGGEREGGS